MTRVLSGAVLLIAAVAAVWFAPPLPFVLIAEALLIFVCVEYGRLVKSSGLHIPVEFSTTAAALVCASFTRAALAGVVWLPIDVVLMTVFVALGALGLSDWRGGSDAVGSTAAALMPSLYFGLPIGAMIAIRETRGAAALFLLMVTVFISDTAQYYSGRAFGRRPLAPSISPKKTIEGAVGGFVFGTGAAAVIGSWWLPDTPLAFRSLLGVAIVACGIVGDLFESMLKRSAGVKDSSTLIPGHGGVLDRIDALLFAAPVYYVILRYL